MKSRIILRASLAALTLLLAGTLFGSSCFAPTYADCAFACASSAPQCPAEYECAPRPDLLTWRCRPLPI